MVLHKYLHITMYYYIVSKGTRLSQYSHIYVLSITCSLKLKAEQGAVINLLSILAPDLDQVTTIASPQTQIL